MAQPDNSQQKYILTQLDPHDAYGHIRDELIGSTFVRDQSGVLGVQWRMVNEDEFQRAKEAYKESSSFSEELSNYFVFRGTRNLQFEPVEE